MNDTDTPRPSRYWAIVAKLAALSIFSFLGYLVYYQCRVERLTSVAEFETAFSKCRGQADNKWVVRECSEHAAQVARRNAVQRFYGGQK